MALEELKAAGADVLLKSKPQYCGWLEKKNKSGKLQQRYCIVIADYLLYFEDNRSKKANGGFPLAGYRACKVRDNEYSRTIVIKHVKPSHRVYVFEAPSEREQEEWITNLNFISKASKEVNVEEFGDAIHHYPSIFQFTFTNDERYVKIDSVSSSIPASFVGPVYMQGTHSNSAPKLPARPLELPARLKEEIYDEIPEDYGKLSILSSPKDKNGNINRYIISHKDCSDDGGYIRLQDDTVDDTGEETYVDMSENKQPDSYYETMHAPQEQGSDMHYEKMLDLQEQFHSTTLYENLDSTRGACNGTDIDKYIDVNRKELDAHHKKIEEIYDKPIPAPRRASEPDRSLPKPPVPSKRSLSLKHSANMRDLPDVTLLPLSVYHKRLEKVDCASILMKIGIPGTYLIRTDRSDGRDALAVLGDIQGDTKHYIIFGLQNNLLYLKKGEPQFKKLADLVKHYYQHGLPNADLKLVRPFT